MIIIKRIMTRLRIMAENRKKARETSRANWRHMSLGHTQEGSTLDPTNIR